MRFLSYWEQEFPGHARREYLFSISEWEHEIQRGLERNMN